MSGFKPNVFEVPPPLAPSYVSKKTGQVCAVYGWVEGEEMRPMTHEEFMLSEIKPSRLPDIRDQRDPAQIAKELLRGRKPGVQHRETLSAKYDRLTSALEG